ncbi:MAG TPA: DUF6799 domain-containing protein [Chitinophagaceae bacterium]
MKALLLLSIGFFLVAPPVMAQDTVIHGAKIRLRTGARIYTVDHLTLYDGTLYLVKNRTEKVVDSILFLPNGMEIHPDGVYKATNGHIYTLRNGEYLDMEGNRYSTIFNFNAGRKMKQKRIDWAQHREY